MSGRAITASQTAGIQRRLLQQALLLAILALNTCQFFPGLFDPNPGFGLDLEVGRDFWAGTPLDRRAIGIALRFAWLHCGAADTRLSEPKPWNAFALSFVFSVGYN